MFTFICTSHVIMFNRFTYISHRGLGRFGNFFFMPEGQDHQESYKDLMSPRNTFVELLSTDLN